jgi:hypothetical protein
MAVVTSYATLQTYISDVICRDDLTSFVPNFIQNAENKLYRTLNLRNEETALSVSISSGVATVPTTFKALKFAYYDATPIHLLQYVSVEELYRSFPNRSTSSSSPHLIAREGSSFIFGPRASDGTLKGIFYAKPTALRTAGTNWYTSNAPEALIYMSLIEAEAFIQDDPRIPIWRQFANEAVQSLIDENAAADTSMGALITRSDNGGLSGWYNS